MIRENLLSTIKTALIHHGFTYQDFSDSNSSFDLIARKQNLVLVLKILSNIDSLRPEHARDLRKIGHAFNAHSLLIGEKSKVFALNSDVLYERYDVPVLSPEGFNQLLDSKLPSQRSFKGQNVVELDTHLLRKQREANELTLKDLSQKVGVSLESLHRYEHGQPAQLEVAMKLEELLRVRLIRGINVFHPAEKVEETVQRGISNTVLDQLEDLGLKLSVFERAPLTAAAKEHELLISYSENKQNLAKKALSMEKTRRIIRYPGIIITKETKHASMDGTPILHEDQLSTFSNAEDMMTHLREKKKKKDA